MDVLIQRKFSNETLTIAANAATSGSFQFEQYAGGMVIVPSAWTAANIGFQVSEDNSTFVILRDYTGVPVQISGIKTDGGRAYAMPAEMFSARFCKLWSKSTTTSTETDTNQASARSLIILLKG